MAPELGWTTQIGPFTVCLSPSEINCPLSFFCRQSNLHGLAQLEQSDRQPEQTDRKVSQSISQSVRQYATRSARAKNTGSAFRVKATVLHWHSVTALPAAYVPSQKKVWILIEDPSRNTVNFVSRDTYMHNEQPLPMSDSGIFLEFEFAKDCLTKPRLRGAMVARSTPDRKVGGSIPSEVM